MFAYLLRGSNLFFFLVKVEAVIFFFFFSISDAGFPNILLIHFFQGVTQASEQHFYLFHVIINL